MVAIAGAGSWFVVGNRHKCGALEPQILSESDDAQGHPMSKHALLLATALLALGGCARPPTLAQVEAAGLIAPVSGDRARIYVFRNFRAGAPPNDPVVYIDGQPVAWIAPGSVFERDVPPGPHVVTTDPKHPEYAEVASLSTPPGSSVFLAVDDNWVDDNTQGSRIPVFSIAPIDSLIARQQAERLPFRPASSEQRQAP